jgi:hypothetical protein
MGLLSIQTVPTVVGGNAALELREAIDEGNGVTTVDDHFWISCAVSVNKMVAKKEAKTAPIFSKR